MKNAQIFPIILTSLALCLTASISYADGSLNTQYRTQHNRNATSYHYQQNPVIYPQQQYYYPQGTTVIIIQQPQRYDSGYDIYQRNLNRNRIGYNGNRHRNSRQNQCLGSHCGE